MFEKLFPMLDMPLAYDTGINVTTVRPRKRSRKGVSNKKFRCCETIVLTSKECAEIAGEAICKLMKGGV